ncbi:ArsR family transcriptional regulator [Bacillus sp. HMF5848]|uniref:ArsR/SmtB family transcription factor n=1 Tax=Bacillus sp. HMF5848 TaxID=2495421 RepID=UPI000F77687E|nr:winged helix-turn-helix domain-containing protein [Bacillus sp. HMF5848]RSK27673.1 ArsR family transcriptional regulator [Bacillus sp. HMF5848]
MSIYTDNIIFQKSPVAELLTALRLIGFGELDNGEHDLIKDVSPEIKEWVQDTISKIPNDLVNEIKVFFNKESYLGLTTFPFAINQKAYHDVHSYVSMLHHLSLEDYYWAFLNTGFSPDLSIERYDHPDEVIKVLNNTNMPEAEKWKVSYLIFDGERTKQRFTQLIERFYYQFFQQREQELLEHQEGFINKMNEELKQGNVKYFSQLMDKYGVSLSDSEVIIFPSYFSDVGTFFASIKRFNMNAFILGIRDYETVESSRGEKETLDAIKILIDEKRFKILQMLNKQPYYGYELAQALEVSNSTMSHHLSTLVANRFIRAIRKENKVYYETNSEEIQSVLKQLETMFIK